jgi:hypothetical protein
MKLLYIGTELCPYDTLQRLMVLAGEICFLDRPSVIFDGQWGTVAFDTPMRQFRTDSETIKLSSFKAPSGAEAGGIYEHYAKADVLNPAFVRVFLNGLRDNEAFSNRYLQPDGNYGTGVNGSRLRQLLVSDDTLYQASFDLSQRQHPSIMYKPDTPEGRRAVIQTLLIDASIRITGALLMADELNAIPIADDNIHPKLLALRTTNPNYLGGTPSLAPFLGLQFVRAVIPDEVLKRLKFSDILSYREKTNDIYAAWNVEISSTAAKIDEADLLNPSDAVQKIIATDLMPKIKEYENEMASVRDKLFGDMIKSVVAWELPTLSIGYLAQLGYTGALAAFAVGAKAAIPHLVDYVNSRRAANRKHAVSYLVGLTRR